MRKNISSHPDLSVSSHEIHYFDRYFYKGIGWFKNHFDYSKKLTVCKNPDLMYIDSTHFLINQTNPFVKIILILREPRSRAYSHYNMLTKLFDEKRTFEECIEDELKYRQFEPKNYLNSLYHILQRGLYYQQIQNLLRYFPKSNIMILITEKVKNNMEEEYNKIYEFLNIKKLYDQKYTEEFVGEYREEIKPDTYKSLLDYYKSDVESLENFLGYKTGWNDFD